MGILWRALGPLGVANKFASASSILFNDSFDTDGAISAGARTADPGPGTATITDSAAVWTSIASSITPVGTPEMRFRVQDANNYWRAYVDIGTGNFCVDSVESGVATNRITGSNVSWYPGDYWLGFQVRAEGTTVQLLSQSAGFITYEGSVTLDYLTSATGVRVTQTDTDYTARSLVCYPISSATYDVFDEV